jgi:hypothetical protein
VIKESCVPAPRNRRRRSALLTAVALTAALLLAGCAGQREPTSYTDGVEEDFTQACWTQTLLDHNTDIEVGDADSMDVRASKATKGSSKAEVRAAKTYCTCVFKAIKKNVEFSEFKKVNDDLREEEGTLPRSFTKSYDSCDAPAFEAG